MKTITFYSYKGGVGRSLVLTNIANRLAEFGKKVCIIDFDLEAPGLHLKFQSSISDGVKTGLVDYIYEFSNSNVIPDDIRDYVTTIKFDSGNGKSDIMLIAAGNTLSREYWQRLSSINWKSFFYDKKSVGVEFFLNLKFQIESQVDPDFLLIDSRTGITDISGITMSIFADEVVLMAANNKENLEGTSQVMKTLLVPSNSILNKRPKINFVLCRIPFFLNPKDKPKETVAKDAAINMLNSELIKNGIHDFLVEKALIVHSDPDLEMEEKIKISYQKEVNDSGKVVPIGLDYLELFEELTKDDISDDEKANFNRFIRSEFLLEKAISNPEPLDKIKGLKAALK